LFATIYGVINKPSTGAVGSIIMVKE